MQHDWIIEVLSDLRKYALAHGMTQLAQQVDRSLDTARDEISALAGLDAAKGSDD